MKAYFYLLAAGTVFLGCRTAAQERPQRQIVEFETVSDLNAAEASTKATFTTAMLAERQRLSAEQPACVNRCVVVSPRDLAAQCRRACGYRWTPVLPELRAECEASCGAQQSQATMCSVVCSEEYRADSFVAAQSLLLGRAQEALARLGYSPTDARKLLPAGSVPMQNHEFGPGVRRSDANGWLGLLESVVANAPPRTRDFVVDSDPKGANFTLSGRSTMVQGRQGTTESEVRNVRLGLYDVQFKFDGEVVCTHQLNLWDDPPRERVTCEMAGCRCGNDPVTKK